MDSNPDWSLRLEKGILLVENDRIVKRAPVSALSSILAKYALKEEDSQFLMPGLIDSHIHASQFPNAGKVFLTLYLLLFCLAGLALDLTLLDWLEKYTFPTEAGLKDIVKAEQVYTRCVRTTLGCGTTTACYFATIHR